MKALRKEEDLEELIKNEEISKIKTERKKLIRKFKHEAKKKSCLKKILSQREEEDEKTRETNEIENEVNKLKQEAIRQVRRKRTILRKKLSFIKSRMKRKNRLIEQQIQKIRQEMASDIVNANKNGDWKICKNSRKDKDKVNEYCNANFIDNYFKNEDCKTENFCYICCENEYGNLFLRKRDLCYTMCDNLAKKDLESGEWVWNKNILGLTEKK